MGRFPAVIQVRELSVDEKSPSPERERFWEVVSQSFGVDSPEKSGSGYRFDVSSNDCEDTIERYWRCVQDLPQKTKLRWSKVQVNVPMQHVAQVAETLHRYHDTLSFWISGMYHEDFRLPGIAEPPAEGHWRFPLIKTNLYKEEYARFDLVVTSNERFIEVWGPSKPLLSRLDKLPFADSMTRWKGDARDRWGLFSER